MAPLTSTRSFVRRLTDPDEPQLGVALMVLASALLLGAVLVALPTSPAEGSDEPVVDVGPVTTAADLISGPGEVVLPEPQDDSHTASVFVNHLHDDIEIEARLANAPDLSVELVEDGPRTTEVVVTSDAVHECGQYAGSLILQATHPELPEDLLVLDVRFAECGDAEAVTMAPDSVDQVESTWAGDGRAPWKPSTRSAPPPEPAAPPPPPAPEPEPEPQPEEPAPETEQPQPESSPDGETDGEGGTTSDQSEPPSDTEPTSEPEPSSDPDPTSDPESSSNAESSSAAPTSTETSTEG